MQGILYKFFSRQIKVESKFYIFGLRLNKSSTVCDLLISLKLNLLLSLELSGTFYNMLCITRKWIRQKLVYNYSFEHFTDVIGCYKYTRVMSGIHVCDEVSLSMHWVPLSNP